MNTAQTPNTRIYILLSLSVAILLLVAFYGNAGGYPGQLILPVIKTLVLGLVVFVYGFFLMLLFRGQKKENNNTVDFATAFAVGLIFTTFYFFVAGFLKILIPAVPLFFIFSFFVFLYVLFHGGRALKISVGMFFKRPLLEYGVFILPLIYASLPSSFYDTLVYHLGIPNLYLQHGGFIETPQFLFANTSIYYEIAMIPAVGIGEQVPRLFHFLVGVIFILAFADFIVKIFDLRKRTMFILLVMSMPMSVFLLSTVKNDLAGAFFVFLGIRYLMEKRFNLSALFWGFSIGVKYFNGLPMVIFLLIYFIREKEFPIKRIIQFGFVSVLTLLPLLIKNFIYAGNPVFPFLTGIFPMEHWDASRYALMKSDVGKMFYSLKDALVFPYTFSFQHSGFGGMVGAQYLIFLPFLLVVKESLKKRWYFLVFAVFSIYIGGNFTASLRFLFIALLFLSAYLAVVYEHLTSKIIRYLFFIVIGFNLISSIALQEFLYRSSELLSGKVQVEEYKANIFPTYPGIAYVNKASKENGTEKDNAIIVGEARNYYLKVPYRVASGIDYSILRTYLKGTFNTQGFIDNLKQDNIRFIIINIGEFNRLQNGYKRMNNEEKKQMGTYFENLKSKMVFREGGNLVFDLNRN